MLRRSSLRPRPTNVALCEPVFLEKLSDDLKIPPPRKVNRVLVPAVEGFLFCEIGWVLDMLVKIDVILNIVLLRDAYSSSLAA